MKVEKKRSKFGKWIENKGTKQQWIADKSGLSKVTVCKLANESARFPTTKNIQPPNIKQDDIWSL